LGKERELGRLIVREVGQPALLGGPLPQSTALSAAKDESPPSRFTAASLEGAADACLTNSRCISSAYMTDAYRHLLDGYEAEAAERFETYLATAKGTPVKEAL
jgi:hypothetical protein